MERQGRKPWIGKLWAAVLVAVMGTLALSAGALAAGPATTEAELVAAVQAAADGDVIELANDIRLTEVLLIRMGTAQNLTIRACDDAGEVTLTTDANGRHIRVGGSTAAARLTFENVVLDGESKAGGIDFSGNELYLIADIRNCYNKSGGGISASGILTINGGNIVGNSSNLGGGIRANHLVLNDGNICDNTALNGGGVYMNPTSSVTINGGSISGNFARTGGGLHQGDFAESLHMTGGVISNNTAETNGGGLYLPTTTTVNISGGEISRNKTLEAGTSGGGIYHRSLNMTISGGEIWGNSSQETGGGIVTSGYLTITGGRIYGNSSATGGGIQVWYNGITVPYLDKLQIRGDAVVADNISSQPYYMTDPNDIALHSRKIDPTVTWTAGFDYIYNNNDVGYLKGEPAPQPEPGHTVTLTQRWADASREDVVTPYSVAVGEALTIDFATPEGYTATVETHADVQVDCEAGTIHVSNVVGDLDILVVYTPVEPEGHTVTVITRYLDDALPEHTDTYRVADGTAFQESFQVLEGYELINMSARAQPDFGVDMESRTVSISVVERDYTITLEFDKVRYNVVVVTQYEDDDYPPTEDRYKVGYGEAFETTFEMAEGYSIKNINFNAVGVSVNRADLTISIDSVTSNVRIVITFRN